MIACIAMMATADKIKMLRRDHAMTQEDLAAKAGRGLATIQRAERGARLSADSLASIAAAFGIAASELAANEPADFEPYLPLTPITSGRQLVALLRASDRLDFGFSELDNLDDAKVVEALYTFCAALAEEESIPSPIAQVTLELEAKDHLRALANRGFCLGGGSFEITAYEVDDDGGAGLAIIFAQWDETRAALRIGKSGAEVARAHVVVNLDKYETLKGNAVIFPVAPHENDGWEDFAAEPSGEGEA